MTAEQLEELMGKVAEGGVDGFYAKHEIRVLRAALLAEIEHLREALAGMVALYDSDDGTRDLMQYRAARAALQSKMWE